MRGAYSKNLRHICRCEKCGNHASIKSDQGSHRIYENVCRKCGSRNIKVFEGVNY